MFLKALLSIALLVTTSMHANLDESAFVYETALILPDQQPIALPEHATTIAYNSNRFLGLSKFFDTQAIAHSPTISREWAKDRTHSNNSVITADNITINFSLFKRNSDTLVVVGPGFTNNKEKMAPFVHMFLDYDIAIINFRGHGYKDTLSLNPLYHALDVDYDARLGAKEEQDVVAVVDALRGSYKNIIGLGICFGAFVFLKSQAIAEQHKKPLFDKLIVDGCWLSPKEMQVKIEQDPYLITNPQQGGAPHALRRCGPSLIGSASALLEALLGISFANIDLRSYLPSVSIPILFFYGKDDRMVTRKEFEEIWRLTASSDKIAIITSNPHVHNHVRSKELYKMICELFIQTTPLQTVEILQNQEALTAWSYEQIKLNRPCIDILKPLKVKQNKNSSALFIALPLLIASGYLIKKYFSL